MAKALGRKMSYMRMTHRVSGRGSQIGAWASRFGLIMRRDLRQERGKTKQVELAAVDYGPTSFAAAQELQAALSI